MLYAVSIEFLFIRRGGGGGGGRISSVIFQLMGKKLSTHSGGVRLGIFWNKNIFRNIFRLFCSWEQNSQNGNPSIPE